jgi:xanthine dehydrogenase YagT iron-sulfur-binding subunit
MQDKMRDGQADVSRRRFLQGAGAAAAGSAFLLQENAAVSGEPTAVEASPGLQRFAATGQTVSLSVNGTRANLVVTPDTTLLQALRESMGLTGSKEVCDRGACGACTVLLDGRSVNSCMLLAIDAIGHAITTVEGLGEQNQLDPIQQAFIKQDACQCGFCIPGFVVRSRALLDETPHPSRAEIKQGLSGNICRCAAYAAIFAAVEEAAQGGGK